MPAKTEFQDPFFTAFNTAISNLQIPERFSLMHHGKPHPLCLIAAKQLQEHLDTQKDWEHNFGLIDGKPGQVIGKMFGVMVVQSHRNEMGYLAAFSGKLAGGNHHAKFVPPVFDSLTENNFLNKGMAELNRMNLEILKEREIESEGYLERISKLKTKRKCHSTSLQRELFSHYHFLNQKGEEKSLNELFVKAFYKNPPAGAGECAGPKLLQYAFQHQMKPLAIAEFWWGKSPKSEQWKHMHYYPCCREKCVPILAHMLNGI